MKTTCRLIVLSAAGGLLMACSPAPEPNANAHEGKVETAINTLQVAAEYSNDTFRLHYKIAIENPSWYHQYWRYHNGEWVRMGSGAGGPDENHLYEDRISMMLDDGSVEGFSRYGGWMLIHPGMRTLDSAASAEEVRAHPVLGEQMGRSDVRKFIPQSRRSNHYTNPAPWQDIKPLEEIQEMQQRGEFLDLWQWRAHRSHPIGYADNGYVLHYRLSSQGRSMFSNNINEQGTGPAYMFNAAETGSHALQWSELQARAYRQSDHYFLTEDTAVPIPAEQQWQEGDVIPFRLLQQPSGARAAIRSFGEYQDGHWRITLERSLASPNPLDSKTLAAGNIYHVAFAVHQGGVGGRHHIVSLPHSLGLGVNADITAHYSASPMAESELNWHEVELINPGQRDWQWLTSQHPGAGLIRGNVDISVQQHHGYLPLFQRYINRVDKRELPTKQD